MAQNSLLMMQCIEVAVANRNVSFIDVFVFHRAMLTTFTFYNIVMLLKRRGAEHVV